MEQIERNDGQLNVKFTPEEYNNVRIWVEGKSQQGSIVATPTRLYLPVGESGMVTVDENDMIWWDPEGGVNAFTVEHLD